MAVRSDDLVEHGGGVVVAFPVARARRRARRARLISARRRLMLLVVTLALAGTVLIGAGSPSGAVASRAGAPSAVTVRPGESLWDIAEQYAPDGLDLRVYVDALQQINDFGGPLQAGAHVRLPG